METIAIIEKGNYGELNKLKKILYILTVTSMVIAAFIKFLLPVCMILKMKIGNSQLLELSINLPLNLLFLLIEIFIHEGSHCFGMFICKGHPHFIWPRITGTRKGWLPKFEYDNPGAIEENKKFTRNQYIFCLLLPIFAVVGLLIVPYFIITEDALWTIAYIFITLYGASNDIIESYILYTKFSKRHSVKMQIELVKERKKCTAIIINEG